MSDIIHHTSRRIFSPQYKLEIVNEALAKQLSTDQVAQKHHINNNQVFCWCREYKLGAARWVKVVHILAHTVFVELASGHVIKLTHPTAETIKQLLSVIV